MDVTNLSTSKCGHIKAISRIPPRPAVLLGLKWGSSNPVTWWFVYLTEGLHCWLRKFWALSSASLERSGFRTAFCTKILIKMSASRFLISISLSADSLLSFMKGKMAVLFSDSLHLATLLILLDAIHSRCHLILWLDLFVLLEPYGERQCCGHPAVNYLVNSVLELGVILTLQFFFIWNFQFKVVFVFNKSFEYFADFNCAISLLGCHNGQQRDMYTVLPHLNIFQIWLHECLLTFWFMSWIMWWAVKKCVSCDHDWTLSVNLPLNENY